VTNLDHALTYAARGWRVIPIPQGLKYPKGYDAWQQTATTDTAQITAWWTTNPDHGVGVVTGAASGVWVLDVDVADGKAGDETLATLEQTHGPLPATYEVITGSGGRHLYFAWDDGPEIRNSASGALGPGLDVRGEGGFVVAPPTIHPNGTAYEVEASAPEVVAPAPAWIVAMLDAARTPEGRPAPTPLSGGWIDVTPGQGERPGDLWAEATSWEQILTLDGWTLHHTDRTGEKHWTRPGKDHRDGTSATTGYGTHDLLKVFTSSMTHVGLTPEATYSKLGYLAATKYGGDHAEAARALRAQGWGKETTAAVATPATPAVLDVNGHEVDPWHLSTPIPLTDTTSPIDVPIDAFPDWMADQIRNVTRQLECDPILPAIFGLGALSVASLGHVQVNVRAGQVEPSTGLYLAAAGKASSGKSPALKFMMGPVRDYEVTRISQGAQAISQATQRHAIAQKAAKEASDNAARTGEPERLDKALRLQAQADELAANIPASGEMMTGDITPERLATLMAENGERMAVVSDESGVLEVDRYGDKSGGRKLDIYLQGFTGEPAVVHRQNAPTVRLRRPLLAMVVGVQPAALAQSLSDKELRDRGFAARFLTASTAQLARNTDIDLDVWNYEVGQRYHDTLLALCTQWGSWATPATLNIDPAGRRTYSGWAAELRDREEGGDLEGEGGWLSKMRVGVLRIAALFHLADGHGHDAPIDADTVMRAIEIGEWFIAHYLHGIDAGGSESAARLLRWLIKEAGGETTEGDISGEGRAMVRDVALHIARPRLGTHGPRHLRKIEDYGPALETLIAHGWVRLAGVRGGPTQQVSQQIPNAAAIELHPCAMVRDGVLSRAMSGAGGPVEEHETQRDAESIARAAHIAYRPFSRPSPSVRNGSTPETPCYPCCPRDAFCVSCNPTQDADDAPRPAIDPRHDLLADIGDPS
jgi:replicative DNA helicase